MNSMAPNHQARYSDGRDDESLVLLVEDNPGDAELVSMYLENEKKPKIVLEKVVSLADAIRALQRKPFMAVILDLGLPDAQGIQSVKGIRSAAKDLPIVVLSGIQDRILLSEAIRNGAIEVLNKDTICSKTLCKSVLLAIERTKLQSKGKSDEYVDPLTDLYNRTGLITVVESLYEMALNSDSEFAVYYICVELNTRQPLSNELIVEAACLLESSFRSSDTIARLMDGEFVLVLNDIQADQLSRISRRISDQFRIRNHRYDVHSQFNVRVGLVCLNREKPKTLEDMLHEAKAICTHGGDLNH